MPKRRRLLSLLCVLSLCGCPAPLTPATLPPPGDGLGEHWLSFVQISDTQLVDEESPARAAKMDGLIAASWRPQETYGVATLDATIAVINARHAARKAAGHGIDCLVVTGDLCDLAQYNELRWFIDTMDGKVVDTDSGGIDGNSRTDDPADNTKLPIDTVGLDPEIPWYSIVGNHDVLAVGNFPVDVSSNSPVFYSAPLLPPVAALIGLHDIAWNLNAMLPVSGKSPAVITGLGPKIDGETLQLKTGKLHAGKLEADTARRFLTLEDFIDEHFNTTSAPLGHGFAEVKQAEYPACYSFRPKAEAPVRFIVLDTVPPKAPKGYPAFYGVVTREMFENFLKPEVDAAKAAGEFVVVLSHHPSADFDLPFPARKVGSSEFREFLAAQPNVLAHLCGHSHINRVHEVPGANPYLEIETGAIIDYPQEARHFDIFFDAATETVTLAAQMFGHLDAPTRLSQESYRRCYIDALQGQSDQKPPEEKYQALFTDATKSWGLGDAVPREKTAVSADERRGTHADRNGVWQLKRRAPLAWR